MLLLALLLAVGGKRERRSGKKLVQGPFLKIAFPLLLLPSLHLNVKAYQDFYYNSTRLKEWVIGYFVFFQHGKKDVVRALLQEGADPGLLDEAQDTAVDLINNRPEMRQVFSDVLMQAAASG